MEPTFISMLCIYLLHRVLHCCVMFFLRTVCACWFAMIKVLLCGCSLNNAIHSFVAVSLCVSYPCEIRKLCSLLMQYFRELIVSGKDWPHSFSRKQQIDDKFILFVDFYL